MHYCKLSITDLFVYHHAHIMARHQATYDTKKIMVQNESGEKFELDFCTDRCPKCTAFALELYNRGFTNACEMHID